jgi:5-methylcytosine-specific restriction enzyme subunit McrC
VLKRFGKIDRLECRYDEYLTDIPENQILLAGLSVCAGRVRHPAVAMRVRRLLGIFAETCTLNECNWRQVRNALFYNRMNEHYREPHDLAWLILEGLGIKDIYASGSQRCYAFLLDMNRLFEQFVTRWLKDLFRNSRFRVISQRRDRSILWNADLGCPYKAVIPDLLVENRDVPGQFLPMDAKYKLYDNTDNTTISSGDIYQTFLYAYAYGKEHLILPTALIVHPASSTGRGQFRLHIRRDGLPSAELQTVPIHIPTALNDARSKSKQVGVPGKAVIDAVKSAFDKQRVVSISPVQVLG